MTKKQQPTPEHIFKLLDVALSGDVAGVRRVGHEIVRAYQDAGQTDTAKQIAAFIRKKGVPLLASGVQQAIPVDTATRLSLAEPSPWPTKPVILNASVQSVVTRFLHDAPNTALLTEHGLASRLGLMLCGPPGTGKSLLAGHIAAQLKKPFFIVRLDAVISSRLGDTAKNIRQVFDFAPSRDAVLFIDEMDAIAKQRDDRQELGELKRVVNTLIQALDHLEPTAIIIGATNHPHLLDPAIWRRFPYSAQLDPPEHDARAQLWLHFLFADDANQKQLAEIFAAASEGRTGADIETIAHAARRHAVLNSTEVPLDQALWAIVASTGEPRRPPQLAPLTTEHRRSVVNALASLEGITQVDLARVLGISRQMINRYLKDDTHG
jgi:MoxR-like ATPase